MNQFFYEITTMVLLLFIYGYLIWQNMKLRRHIDEFEYEIKRLDSQMDERIKNELVISKALSGTKDIFDSVAKAHNGLVERVAKLENNTIQDEDEKKKDTFYDDLNKVINYSPSKLERQKREREAE